MSFSLTSEFKPTGDQPKAIKSILDSFNTNQNHVTLQGVTGSGKTFTVANVIQEIKKPTLDSRMSKLMGNLDTFLSK